MAEQPKTIRLTTAQALVRHLVAQKIEVGTEEQPLFAGVFAIFGHGNVSCLGEALHEHRENLPTWRGQNEQSMALAAIAYAKAKLRRRILVGTSSIGPGATNMVTAAGVAHSNRLPVLLLSGDTYHHRLPDPVLQQVEHFGSPATTVNDAFRPVTRFWDRITHPAQLVPSLTAAIDTMLDPADCGPAFLGLPQDVQGIAYDYPARFFSPRTHRIRRIAPDPAEVREAVELLRTAERPLIIAGGGVQYSLATAELAAFAEAHRIPVVETIAGRANLRHDHPLNCGPLGVTGSNSANALAARADVILAIGTRLQDFTTGSWTAFHRHARIITINVGRHDAAKHMSAPVIGDAKTTIGLVDEALGDWSATDDWNGEAAREVARWNDYVDSNTRARNGPMTYAQVVGAVNRLCGERDRVLTAAGGLPAELAANWRTKGLGTVDIEFGFSCMGYEVAGGWGARIAQEEDDPNAETFVLVGDGSYLLQNSDIYSSVLSGKKMIVIVCDNGGFAVIDKLQNNTGNVSFNNLIADCKLALEPFAVDFASHARAMGAVAETVTSVTELEAAISRARQADRTFVISLQVDPHESWTTEGHTWWEVGMPEVSNRPEVLAAGRNLDAGRSDQRRGV